MQLPVASITTSSVARSLLPKPSNAVRVDIDTSCPSKPTFLPENHLAEGSVGIYPDYTSHARLLFVQKDGSGGLHDNYGFALAAQPGESQRRPTTNTSSQLNVRDRPARTFVLPAPLSRMVTPYAAIPKTTARHRRRDSHTGYESDRKHLRDRPTQDNPLEGMPVEQDGAREVFKLVEGAQKTWRRLDGHNQLPKIIRGVKFTDGCEVIAKPGDLQSQTAA